MADAIVATIEYQKNLEIYRSSFIGISIDESTNIAQTILLSLILYSIFPDFTVDWHFIGIPLLEKCDAITQIIVSELDKRRVQRGKVIGIGLDRASVMTGIHSGVGVKL